MSIEFFQRKRAVFEKVTEALEAIDSVARQMSVPERIEVLTALHDMFHVVPGDYEYEPKEKLESQTESKEGKFSSPARAVETLLLKSPVPLYASDIVKRLESEIDTTSKSPKDVIYSAIAYLKREGKIVQLDNKSYMSEGNYKAAVIMGTVFPVSGAEED